MELASREPSSARGAVHGQWIIAWLLVPSALFSKPVVFLRLTTGERSTDAAMQSKAAIFVSALMGHVPCVLPRP